MLVGGSGRDLVLARDGDIDRILCGPGRDTVRADNDDRVAGDCEVVGRATDPTETPDAPDGPDDNGNHGPNHP